MPSALKAVMASRAILWAPRATGRILRRNVENVAVRWLGDHQCVALVTRPDIEKGQNGFVLIDRCSRGTRRADFPSRTECWIIATGMAGSSRMFYSVGFVERGPASLISRPLRPLARFMPEIGRYRAGAAGSAM